MKIKQLEIEDQNQLQAFVNGMNAAFYGRSADNMPYEE